MTCQECETMLAIDDRPAAVTAHVAECAECRALADELAANSDALREMSAEPMPQVRSAVWREIRARESRRRVLRWGWALAAAAAVVLAIGVARRDRPAVGRPFEAAAALPRGDHKVEAVHRPEHRRAEARRRPERVAPQEPLKVKMLTADPNVVIYWLVEPKERSE